MMLLDFGCVHVGLEVAVLTHKVELVQLSTHSLGLWDQRHWDLGVEGEEVRRVWEAVGRVGMAHDSCWVLAVVDAGMQLVQLSTNSLSLWGQRHPDVCVCVCWGWEPRPI